MSYDIRMKIIPLVKDLYNLAGDKPKTKGQIHAAVTAVLRTDPDKLKACIDSVSYSMRNGSIRFIVTNPALATLYMWKMRDLVGVLNGS